jgi:two-component system nitrogen regulation response regulator GlnG
VSKGEAILREDLPPEILSSPAPAATDPGMRPDAEEGRSNVAPENATATEELSTLARQLFRWARTCPDLKIIPAVERELIIQALIETQGNQVQAAKLLGITRATLRKRVEKHKITRQLWIR